MQDVLQFKCLVIVLLVGLFVILVKKSVEIVLVSSEVLLDASETEVDVKAAGTDLERFECYLISTVASYSSPLMRTMDLKARSSSSL